MLGALSIDAYLPALKTIAQDYSVTLPAVQQTLTVYLFAFGFMTLFYGTLSDSFGRRPVILVSLVCYLVSSIGAACAPSLGWLLFFRLLQGLSAGAGSVIGRAIVGDMFSGAEAQRIMAYISMVFGMAPALAPILGGWLLAACGWKSIFYFIAFFTLVLLIACIFWLPESLVAEKRHAFHFRVILRNYIDVGSHWAFLLRSVGTACTFVGIMVYVAAAPVYIIDLLHLSVKEFAWLFVTFISGMTLGSMASGHYSHRLKPKVIIQIGYAVMIVAALSSLAYTAYFVPRVPWAVIPHFFYGLGMAFASPAMTVLTLEMFPKVKGLPSSLQGFIFMFLFALISGALAPLLFASAFRLALGTVIGLGISIILWWLGSRGQSDHPVLTDEEQALTEEAPHL
jgi:DHA1 family bicyclomycin/chloramphenicol resistance-like MFS transporter